ERGAGSGTLRGQLQVPLPAPGSQYRDLRDRLVIPESHEHRLSEQTLDGPFLIPHLRHERRLDPGMARVLWRGPGERGLGANSLLQRRADVFELRRGEAAATRPAYTSLPSRYAPRSSAPNPEREPLGRVKPTTTKSSVR